MEEDWVDLCNECKVKIMQCVRLLTSDTLQPAAVVVSIPEIPSTKELGRTCRTDLLELLEKLR
jgi:NifB/MoaA-like Fe-S oxidoreductase